MDSILQDISIYQWLGFTFGVAYLIFTIYDKKQCWICAIVSTVCIAIEDFLHLHLYFNGVVQLFYTLIAICGIIIWLTDGGREMKIRIFKLSHSKSLAYLLIALCISLPMSYIIQQNSDAAMPYLDGFVAMTAIVATFLMIYKILDAWLFWILVNAISIYLFYQQGAPLIAFLQVLYLMMAVVGYRKWKLLT